MRKGFPKCSLILFVNVNHTLHHLSHRLIFFRMEVAKIPFHYFSAWLPNHTTVKLKDLPSFARVADLKAINLTTAIGTHDSYVVLQPLECVARMRLLDVH